MINSQPLPPGADGPPPTYLLSGWWRRAAAYLVDGLVVGIPATLVSGIVAVAFYGSLDAWILSDEIDVVGEIAAQLAVIPICIAYYCIIMSKTDGQTVGKMALSIRVVREDGEAMTAGFAFKRQILVIMFLFSYLSIFLCFIPTILNYLAPLWDDGNRAWHDRIVGSRVVFSGPLPDPPAPSSPPVPLSGSFPYTPPPGFENPVPEKDD